MQVGFLSLTNDEILLIIINFSRGLGFWWIVTIYGTDARCREIAVHISDSKSGKSLTIAFAARKTVTERVMRVHVENCSFVYRLSSFIVSATFSKTA